MTPRTARPHIAAIVIALWGCSVRAAAQSARVITSHGFRITRSETYIAGLRVIDHEQVSRLAPDGHVDWETTRSFDRVEATRAARDAHAHWAQTEPQARALALHHAGLHVDEAERVLLTTHSRVQAAWRITVRNVGTALDVFVLVPSLEIAGISPRFSEAFGEVYPRNPISDEGRTARITLPALSAPDALTNASFDVRSCDVQSDGRCLDVRRAFADANGDFLFAPDATSYEDGFAEVNAFHHLSELADRFERDHGFRYACPVGGAIDVRVNYTLLPREPHANAAFLQGSAGTCASFIFGQASTFDFAYDADVLHHEFAHLVTSETAGLVAFAFDAQGAHYEPLAISEGTSDYWAAVMQGDGTIGESVRDIALIDRALTIRDIDPVYTCPASLEGSGHLDGRIWSSAMWALRRELGPKVDTLMYLTVASLLRTTTIAETAQAALETGVSLVGLEGFTEGDVTRIEALFRARGLFDCRRVVRVEVGDRHALYSGLASATGAGGARLAPVQIAVAASNAPERIVFSWRPLSSHGRYVLHLRHGAPVAVEDRAIVSDEHVELTGPSVSFSRLAACEELFFAIETLDLSAGATFVELTLTSLQGGTSCDEDAGLIDAGSSTPTAARGGSCAVHSGGQSAPLFTLAAAALGLLRPRRRRGI